MPKLVVNREGRLLFERALGNAEVVIGRGQDCSVHLNDPAVSRHHAKVVHIYTGYFVEDLHSTNGVTLNGRRVRKHMLRNGDVVTIGTHDIRFEDDAQVEVEDDSDKTVVLKPIGPAAARPVAARPTPAQRRNIAPPPPSEQAGKAFVRPLTGPEQGDSKLVDKSLYTIGEPGGNLAVISRRAQGYFLLHLGGEPVTTLNDREVHGAGVKLNNGDLIQVGDTRLEFYTEQ